MTPCQENPDLWVSDKDADRAKAATLCKPCHRIDDCLTEALRKGEKDHVYGGVDLSSHVGRQTWGVQAEAKACEGCGGLFSPRSNEHGGAWRARKFCSQSCANRTNMKRRAA